MNETSATLDQLTERLQTLEQRVYVLEHPGTAAPVVPAVAAAQAPMQPAVGQDEAVAGAGRFFPLVGRAMLGVAGAYVLRAVAESTSLPRLAVAGIAIAYALGWLYAAVAVKASSWLPSAIYAGTSALILAPMLWELTLKFNVLQPAATAGVLAVYALAASALSWKRDLAPVVWVSNGMAAVTALGLASATGQLIPFIAVLLLQALVCEVAAEFKHELTVRPFLAAAADVGTWALMFIYAGPPAARSDYPAIGTGALLAPALALFAIYAVSIAVRTAWLGQHITVFETIQAMAAFLLAAGAVRSFAPRFGTVGIGVVCLWLAAACFGLVFKGLRGVGAGHNYQVFSAWATGLLFLGSLLCLGPAWQAVCIGSAAVATTVLGVRLNRLTLQVHGALLLLGAAVASGLLAYTAQSLAGTLPARLTPAMAMVAVCAVACYSAGQPTELSGWIRQCLRLTPAALAVCAAAALLVQALLTLAAVRMAPGAHHVAFLRTLAASVVALGLAFAGSRWRRVELTRIAYAVLAFIAAKLVLEDLRHGHFEFIAASIFLFAITLIGVPHLARQAQKP